METPSAGVDSTLEAESPLCAAKAAQNLVREGSRKLGRMNVEEVDEALIDGVCARLRDTLSGEEAGLAEDFVRQYYRWVSPEDLGERSEQNLYGAALAHFEFARERE